MIKLYVRNLAKHYNNVLVFRGVSLNAQTGVTGIAGPNGSGKSTLLKCLAYLVRPDKGTVEWIDGKRKLSASELRSRLGYAAPYINLYTELSCLENLRFLVRIRNLKLYDGILQQLLGRVGLSRALHRPFGQLSSGQQQRLRLATALLPDPEVLILDEPATNLDEAGRAILQAVVDECRGMNRLLFLASNDPADLDGCDQVFNLPGRAMLEDVTKR